MQTSNLVVTSWAALTALLLVSGLGEDFPFLRIAEWFSVVVLACIGVTTGVVRFYQWRAIRSALESPEEASQ